MMVRWRRRATWIVVRIDGTYRSDLTPIHAGRVTLSEARRMASHLAAHAERHGSGDRYAVIEFWPSENPSQPIGHGPGVA